LAELSLDLVKGDQRDSGSDLVTGLLYGGLLLLGDLLVFLGSSVKPAFEGVAASLNDQPQASSASSSESSSTSWCRRSRVVIGCCSKRRSRRRLARIR